MTITDAELVRALATLFLFLVGACGTVAWWAVRVVVSRFAAFEKEMRREVRGLDRRVTRVEAVLRLPTPNGDDDHHHEGYAGTERRAPA